MKRLSIILFLLSVTTVSCQQYSVGVQQSLARADESVVISMLRTISLAEQAYSVSSGGAYATLEQLVDGGYLDERFKSAKPIKDYVLVLEITAPAGSQPAGYTCNANPDRIGARAGRYFFISSASSQIRVNETKQASEADEILK